MKDLYSVFEDTHKKGNKWISEYHFYKGDLSNVDLENDWRFKEIKDKRKQSKFLGTVNTDFPINYPLHLNNGAILEKLK